MYTPPPFHERRPDLVLPVRSDPTGVRGPTRGEARGPRWRTTSRGLVVPATVERTAGQRVVEAAAVLGEDEAVTGWAALHWGGAAWFDGTRDGVVPLEVPVVARRHLVAQDGFAVSQEFLHPDEIIVVDGLPVTVAVRSVVYEMRYAASLGDAIVALDMACYSDKVSLAEVATYIRDLGPVTGIQQARDALAEGEENSWSPQESRMRGVWTRRAGLARPLCNAPVFTVDGRHVGTPDFLDPELGLSGLYNGSEHLTLVGASTDLKQEAAYRDLGLEPIVMLSTDWLDLDAFVERIHSAARRARSARGPRRWTADPPPWWTPTHTVARRRALDDAERARLLRYRRAA
ncbi:hypothetical protein J2X46_001621 [Nocardioides sp. BE266]|uniref:hypothetical protein n=1 Tax=Nocardioides sp. BE266 TaxID=2817725 RepID=UPI002866887E|nr:hypothetical protein [Nocardioides sp. BE266]MDR7252645.1 hypothetical protein [Nocardioides sp. BE266]